MASELRGRWKPERTKSMSLELPIRNQNFNYCLATDAIVDYQAGVNPTRCYIDMTGEKAPIRIEMDADIERIDQLFAQAAFCPITWLRD